MSEEEKRRRADYVKARKRKISRRAAIVAIVLLVAVVSAILASVFNKTHYVNYKEESSVDYGVYLKENDFYDKDYLDSSYDYVASLIDKIKVDFRYALFMDAKKAVKYDYTYNIDAVIEIKSRTSDKVLYNPAYRIDSVTYSGELDGINIAKVLDGKTAIDYQYYNKIAEDFIEKHLSSTGAEANLVVKLSVDIKSKSNEFHYITNRNKYVAAISVPLASETTNVKITSDIPKADGQILSYTTESISRAFTVLSVAFGAVGVILAILLLLYIESSKNHDVTYESRISRLLAAYKSYIQRLTNGFDTEGYQVLMLSTFDEMLEIRDTIQSPILMDENEDKTCTHFLIPTNTNLLYIYEVKVGDYDEIYGSDDTTEYVKSDDTDMIDNPEQSDIVSFITEVEEPVESAMEPIVEDIIEETIPEPVEEVAEEISEESAEQAVEETTEEPAKEAEEELVPESEVKEPSDYRIMVHAEPDFNIMESKSEPTPEAEPTVITVDAPVDINAGAKDDADSNSSDIKFDFNLSYQGESLINEVAKVQPTESAPMAEPTAAEPEVNIDFNVTYNGESLVSETVGSKTAEPVELSQPEINIDFNITYNGESLLDD